MGLPVLAPPTPVYAQQVPGTAVHLHGLDAQTGPFLQAQLPAFPIQAQKGLFTRDSVYGASENHAPLTF